MNKLLAALLVSTLIQAKDSMIITLPRSGSTFFSWRLQDAHNFGDGMKCNNDFCHPVRIAREFFNFLGGAQADWTLIFKEFSDAELQKAYDEDWKPSGYNVTKELYTYMRLPFLQKKFDIVCLYRHRKHTFPSSWPDLFLKIYESFMYNSYSDKKLNLLKKYLLDNAKTDIQKQVAIHTITWYLMFKGAQKYHFSIIEYHKIMRLDKKELDLYLKQKLPHQLYKKNFSELLCKTRENYDLIRDVGRKFFIKYYVNKYVLGKDWIDLREENYRKLNVEPFCQKLLAYMKMLDKDFNHWDRLV